VRKLFVKMLPGTWSELGTMKWMLVTGGVAVARVQFAVVLNPLV
jgi:hypothetical protein